jgi:hypothetical protein
MAFTHKEEAAAFIQTLRLTVKGKTGFGWLSDELDELSEYVEKLADENERLKGICKK